MTRELQVLLEKARKIQPSEEHREEQRRSFVYGNTHFENEHITREMVTEQAEKLAREKDEQRG